MSDLSVRDVVRDPEWLPHTYDPDGTALTFVHVTREARSQLRFLFDEQYQGKFTKLSFPVPTVDPEIGSVGRGPLHHIFHTSLCGSTLLTRTLEMPGVASSMKEPAVFISMANRMNRGTEQANAERLERVLRLLERPLAPGETVVAKHSNFANRLAGPALEARPQSKAVLLYSDLETFLIGLLKRGMWGRILGRKLFLNLKSWTTLKLDFDEKEILELTDMQVASLSWLMHIQHFHDLVGSFGPRVMPIESNEMFAAPAAVLHRVMTFFGLGLSESEVEAIVAGPTFSKHSKYTDRDYSVDQRQRDLELVGNANSEELTMVTKWLETYAAHHGVSLRPAVRSAH